MKKEVSYNEDDTKDTNGAPKAPKLEKKTEKPTPKKAAPKRKAEPEDDEEKAEKPQKAAPKKRKTAKVKEEDAMPLAERTAVSSLGKAMYIGAHVSGAGGKMCPPNL